MFAELTSEGLQLVDMLIEVHFQREARLLEAIGEKDQRELFRILRALDESMSTGTL